MTDELNGGKSEFARLQKLASKKRFAELDAEWTRSVEEELVAPAFLISVLEKLSHAGDVEQAESMLWFLLTERAERKGAAAGLSVAKAAVESFPDSGVLREETAALYRAAHPDFPGIEPLTEVTVAQKDLALPAAVARIEKFLAFRPGSYVLDPDRGEPGRVDGFDVDARALRVSFEHDAATYDAAAVDALEGLGGDDFRALLVFDPAKLAALADEDPGELVTGVLRAFGPRLTFKQFKGRLAGVVPAASWAAWWAAARPRLQRAPWVDVADKAQPAFSLRSHPIAYEDILKAQFNSAPTAEAKLVGTLAYLDEVDKGAFANTDLLAFYARQLGRLHDERCEAEPAAALAALAVAAELHRKHPDPAPEPNQPVEPLVPGPSDLTLFLSPIHTDKVSVLMLELLRRELPGRWADICVAALPGCSQGGCEWIATQLAAERAADLHRAADEILARPARHARALVWLWRTVCGGGHREMVADVDPVAVALALFSAASALGRGAARSQEDQQHLLPQVRAAISLRDYGPLHIVLKEADEERAQRIKTSIDRHTGLSDSACHRVRDVLRGTHPGLFAEHVDPWDEDAVYTTEAGLQKRRGELQHLVSIKLAEASKAVGTAADRGDLSENAEWVAAKEERDRLAQRAGRMQEELNKARIVTREMMQSETVTIGSAVEARDLATDQVETLVFLGPWDADHERNVYSYRARIGLAFMGKSVGDRVTLQADDDERTWEVVAIRPAT